MKLFMKPQDKQGNIPQLSRDFAKIHLTKTNQRKYTSKIVPLIKLQTQTMHLYQKTIHSRDCMS